MYSRAAEDEDNKMVERWQKDADGIIIFVSPDVAIHTRYPCARAYYYRPVYSRQQSPHSLP